MAPMREADRQSKSNRSVSRVFPTKISLKLRLTQGQIVECSLTGVLDLTPTPHAGEEQTDDQPPSKVHEARRLQELRPDSKCSLRDALAQ